MKKIIITAAIVVLVLTATYFLIADHCLIYKPAWLRRMKHPDYASRSELKGIANGYQQAGLLPPDIGFTELVKPNGHKAIRCQYVDGRPAVIGTGRDMAFGTDDDIVCHYEPKEASNNAPGP